MLEHNIRRLYLDIAWWGVSAGVTGTYLAVFAIRMGASNAMVGWLIAIPALISVFVSIPASRAVERQTNRLTVVMSSGFWMRFGWLLVALAPFALKSNLPLVLVALTAVVTIPTAISVVSFNSLLADLVPPEHRARVVSIRNVLMSAVSLGTVLLLGLVLDRIPVPLNYQLAFGLAWATSMVSLYHVSKLKAPPRDVSKPVPAAGNPSRQSTKQLLSMVFAEKQFARFTIAAVIAQWGLNFPVPLYSIYRVRDLGASDAWVSNLSVIFTAVNIVAFYWWGRMGRRWSDRRIVLYGLAGLAAFPLLMAASTSLPPLIFVNVVGGTFSAAVGLGMFNESLAVCPTDRRPTFIAVFTAITSIPIAIGPIVGALVSDWIGIRQAMLVGGGFRILSVLAMQWLAPYADSHHSRQGAPSDDAPAPRSGS
jgi:MFS family permease